MQIKSPLSEIKKIIKEELKKFILEQGSIASPVYSMSDSILYLFDFDDTLAHTDNVVKVTQVNPATGEIGDTQSMDSEAFEKYRQKSPEEREKDIVNYEDFETVLNPVEIQSVLDIVRRAKEDPDGIVAIITARAGEKNSKDISSFLESKGLKNIPVHTVGDQGGKPSDKLKVVRKYVDDYMPKEVFFYDDSRRNLSAIISLCSGEYPGLKVNTFDVINGDPVPAEECNSSDEITL
jgi:hypothetical protein